MDQFEKYLLFKKEIAQATLEIVNQFQKTDHKAPVKRTSKIKIVIDVLQSADQPLHISEIIRLSKQNHGVELSRDSIASALLKKVHANQGVVRTAPNTFALTEEGK